MNSRPKACPVSHLKLNSTILQRAALPTISNANTVHIEALAAKNGDRFEERTVPFSLFVGRRVDDSSPLGLQRRTRNTDAQLIFDLRRQRSACALLKRRNVLPVVHDRNLRSGQSSPPQSRRLFLTQRDHSVSKNGVQSAANNVGRSFVPRSMTQRCNCHHDDTPSSPPDQNPRNICSDRLSQPQAMKNYNSSEPCVACDFC